MPRQARNHPFTVPPASGPVAKASTMNALNYLRNNRILVIDDNRSIHDDIRKILKGRECDTSLEDAATRIFGGDLPVSAQLSFLVDAALQGEEGLRMMEAAAAAGVPYAMAFVDMRMPPGWDGVETIVRLWKQFPDLQVVICTAYSDHCWEEVLGTMGRSDNLLVLKKPFDSIEVLQLANALTQKWSLNHQVKCRFQDLDRLVAQRTRELQSANEQLKREIDEQGRLENQLRQAQKMEAVGQLAAGVAHDFNNILTVVQGNASLLLTGKTSASPDCEPLQKISVAAERAATLVGQLTTFCRKQVAELQPTHLRDAFADFKETLLSLVDPNIRVETHAPPDLPMVNADGPMVETLLTHLAENARDAMPEGGILSLSATPVTIGPADISAHTEAREGEFVRLSVTDTGSGIPAEFLPRIFEPFFTTKPVGKGTGLGLATVYGIVKQHQGWVEVQTQVNHGTAFHIFLPVVTVVEKSQTPPPAAPSKRATARETILVVDDEPDLRILVTQVLESGGYRVLAAGSGAEALEQWAKRRGDIHLLLTDVVMPDGMTGRILAERLRSEDPRLRVIYTSGYTPGVPGTELANIEEHNFLAKPYRPATLLQFVRDRLDQPISSGHTAQKAA
jgi:signal transduction histidine kinase